MKNKTLLVLSTAILQYTVLLGNVCREGADSLVSENSADRGVEAAPYIRQVLNADTDVAKKLVDLQKLSGTRITGDHWHYPRGETSKKRSRVEGVIEDIAVVEGEAEGIYRMAIRTGETTQSFLFSGTSSPAFSRLEIRGTVTDDMTASLQRAGRDSDHSPDLLSVGADTPPRVATYKNSLRTQRAVVFSDHRYPYYELSGDYGSPIVIGGHIWPSVTHYVEAHKFARPDGSYTKDVMRIARADTAVLAANMGRDRSVPLRHEWEEVRDEIMLRALTAKFTQYPHLRTKLLETGDAPIVEHTERDLYWGDGEDGRGQSMLGTLLVQLRDALKRGYLPNDTYPLAFRWRAALAHMREEVNPTILLAQEMVTRPGMDDADRWDALMMVDMAWKFFDADAAPGTPTSLRAGSGPGCSTSAMTTRHSATNLQKRACGSATESRPILRG